MNNLKVIFPYPVGTCLDKIEDGKKHTDLVYEYIVTKDGVFAILLLDVNVNPRLSTRISVNELTEKWTLTQNVCLNISSESIKSTCNFFGKVKRKTKN